ncbi:MAG: hypothetical protein A3F67_10955 [Verrucomicrobia bacterium RIFCSPHIGHO2_12_FULL_41_10]|nr:MAG: hypothetical protein A3F67_10955 [Verrucomicrobia bacterium RIFCSPHIGHO2_12_FULL_41_10]
MAEDAVVEVAGKEEVVENAIEHEARTLGWKPQEEFEGPEGKWINAHEFVSRQPLFEKIDSLKGEVWKIKQEHQQEFTKIKGHFDQMREVEYNRALNYLKAQKKEALENSDTSLVVELDDQIDNLKDSRAAEKVSQVPVQKGPDPDFVQWAEKNTWYAQEKDLRDDADAFAMAYVSSHPNAPVGDVLKHVDVKMKKLYPEKFDSPARVRQASVESGSSSGASVKTKGKLSENDLDETEREVMKTLVSRKILTKEKYLDDLAVAKGLK